MSWQMPISYLVTVYLDFDNLFCLIIKLFFNREQRASTLRVLFTIFANVLYATQCNVTLAFLSLTLCFVFSLCKSAAIFLMVNFYFCSKWREQNQDCNLVLLPCRFFKKAQTFLFFKPQVPNELWTCSDIFYINAGCSRKMVRLKISTQKLDTL